MPSAVGQRIETEDTVVGQRPLARRGHLAATDEPHIGHGVVGGATRPGGDERGAPPGEAGDAVEAGGGEGLGQGQIGEDRGQAPGQPRCPRPGGTQEQDVGGRAPASRLTLLDLAVRRLQRYTPAIALWWRTHPSHRWDTHPAHPKSSRVPHQSQCDWPSDAGSPFLISAGSLSAPAGRGHPHQHPRQPRASVAGGGRRPAAGV